MLVKFNDKIYRKNGDVQTENGDGLGRLCLDIFKFYLKNNPHKTYEELKNIFNSPSIHTSLSGKNSIKKVLFNKEDFFNWYNNPTVSDTKKDERYFGFKKYKFKDNKYNGEELFFTTQWGNSDGNIDKMVNFAKQEKYNIIEKIEEKNIKITDKPLNQILYGPPGTGKTYNTINKALEIIDGVVPEDRGEAKARFEEYKKAGQIEFITFHQSYGYEEFVEGIKAKTSDKGIEYEIEAGIFKKLCEKAENNLFSIGQKIAKYEIVSLSNELMKLKRENGSLIPIPIYLLDEILALVEQEVITTEDINNKLAIEKMNHEAEKYIINGYPNVFRELAQYFLDNKKNKNTEKKNHILVIDEINRGNISKIFGELITLIEPSKRIGKDEEIKVKLPYSNDDFGVPSNLYIIGTMNTADRSIALMDTALRRRFDFEEMMPCTELLDFEVDGINIKSMLEKINKRVEYLYDRDHTIGHAYFMSLKDNQSFSELENIFRNKIIPLLQEYFYNDWEKILMVLGDGFVQKSEIKSDIFDYKQDDYLEEEKFVYVIKENFDFSKFK